MAKEPEEKLKVLSAIAHVLNEAQVLWAVGGSLLLYFKGITDTFRDLDLMVAEEDAGRVRELLSGMGTQALPNPDAQYRTRHFLEFTIDGVEVDVLAGFVIVKDGKAYECPLLAQQVAEQICLNDEKIPLQSLTDWRRYYELMGRGEKAEKIDRFIADI